MTRGQIVLGCRGNAQQGAMCSSFGQGLAWLSDEPYAVACTTAHVSETRLLAFAGHLACLAANTESHFSCAPCGAAVRLCWCKEAGGREGSSGAAPRRRVERQAAGRRSWRRADAAAGRALVCLLAVRAETARELRAGGLHLGAAA